MLVVDYDYKLGKTAAERIGMGPWWDVISLFWLLLSAMIMLNLFIALMTDRLASMVAGRGRGALFTALYYNRYNKKTAMRSCIEYIVFVVETKMLIIRLTMKAAGRDDNLN